MAKDFESLAAQLRSPIPGDIKAALFSDRIAFYQKHLAAYLDQIKNAPA